jgi:aspartyl-tRNA(Asn)/glutamyl-tRNA(Gln) amidotransferase subunit B
LFGALKVAEKGISQSPISAGNLGKLLDLIADDTISGRIAKDVFAIMFETGQDPVRIVEEKGLKQITDTGAIEAAVDQVISENPEQANEVSQGNGKAIGWFVGQVMQKTQGKANPQTVNKMLRDKLGG